MQVKLIQSTSELLKIKPNWDDLIENSTFKEPFYSWFWFERWWKYFGKSNELYIIYTVDDKERMLAIAPFMQSIKCLRVIPVKELSFLDNAIAPRNSLLYRDSEEAITSIQFILSYLVTHCKDWDIINLRSIVNNAPYLEMLDKMKGFQIVKRSGLISPVIKIKTDFQTYFADNFDAKQRRSRKRGLKKVSRAGNYYVKVFKSVLEIESALEETFRVSKLSWKGNLGTDMASSDASKCFYTDITNYFAKLDQVRIWILFLNEAAIAIQYHLKFGKSINFLINDFDKAYEIISPGNALLYHVIKNYHDDKLSVFDFGGADMGYKMKWANDSQMHFNIELFSRKPYSSLIYLIKNRVLPLFRKLVTHLKNRKRYN